MKKHLLLFFILCLCIDTDAQNKRDYYWPFGKDQSPEPGLQASAFDFNIQPFEPQIRQGGLSFDQNNTSICDEEGNLLFYSNGCAVANRFHEVMPNGTGINAGRYFSERWFDGDCSAGYPGRQDILALPDPNNDQWYYLIQKPLEYNPILPDPVYNKYIRYSWISMARDSGRGDVITHNKELYEGEVLWSYLTAINHSNGKDWWIIQPKENPDCYVKILIDSNGLELHDEQIIGREFDDVNASAAGEAKFSPDGKKYAYYNTADGLYLFDFNRKTGELSNYQFLPPNNIANWKFAAVEFSPNSEFLYLIVSDSIWQIETYAEDTSCK